MVERKMALQLPRAAVMLEYIRNYKFLSAYNPDDALRFGWITSQTAII